LKEGGAQKKNKLHTGVKGWGACLTVQKTKKRSSQNQKKGRDEERGEMRGGKGLVGNQKHNGSPGGAGRWGGVIGGGQKRGRGGEGN